MTADFPKAVTQGMNADYNAHSAFQTRVLDSGKPIIADVLKKIILPQSPQPFSMVDYGCSVGNNSIQVIRFIIEEIRKRKQTQEFLVVHNDLASNDFNQLLKNIYYEHPESYLKLSSVSIWPLFSGVSFYQQILPSASVCFGTSHSAAHWLQEMPVVNFPQGIYFSEAQGETLKIIQQASANDWQQFLTIRAQEIMPNGYLFVQILGKRLHPENSRIMQISGQKLLQLMAEICEQFILEKKLKQEVYDCFLLPVVARSIEEVMAPLENTALKNYWRCAHVSVDEIPNPYYEGYQKTHDKSVYAREYVGFVRAFSESTFLNYLFKLGAINIAPLDLSQEFYQRLYDIILADPERGVYECYMLSVMLERV